MSRYRFHDEMVVRQPVFVVPAGQVEVRTSGWTVRRRGDTEGTVKHTYRCPVHGQFDVHVSRAEVPDSVACMFRSWSETQACGAVSPWAGSMCGIGFAAGEVTS